MDLYGLKEDSMEVAKIGASALAGAAVAKVVVGKVGPMIFKDPTSALAKYVPPLLPIAVGIAVHSYGKSQFPIAAPGVAAGMVAYGIAGLVKAVLPAAKAGETDMASYLPFNLSGLGYTYDSALQGLGYSYGAGVDAYMHGAPTQVQSLMGMPVQVQTLSGLGSTIVGSSAPLSASLM
jgi:hypothetical protein